VHVDRRAVASAGQKAVLVLAHIGDLHRQPHARERQDNRESQGRKVDHHAVPISVLSLFPAFVFRERFVRRIGRLRAAGGAATCADIGGSKWHDPMIIVRRFGALSRHGSDSGLSRFSRPYRRWLGISSQTEITFAAKPCSLAPASAAPSARRAKKKSGGQAQDSLSAALPWFKFTETLWARLAQRDYLLVCRGM